jgi:hypothetical protein
MADSVPLSVVMLKGKEIVIQEFLTTEELTIMNGKELETGKMVETRENRRGSQDSGGKRKITVEVGGMKRKSLFLEENRCIRLNGKSANRALGLTGMRLGKP